ncbi:hypothetical protein D3C87_891630 [compost metagenome]
MTIKYKIEKYNLVNEEYCFEHEDSNVVAAEALRLCSSDNGQYTYRMEAWEDNKMIGGWRFFQDGREFTDWIKRACSKK